MMGWRKKQGTIARAASAVLAVVGGAAAPLFVHAAVVFSPNPLFSVDNALAGDGASGTVVVTNPTQESLGVWLSVVGGTSTRNLADALVWTVKEGDNTVYGPESFGLWFDEAPRFLATLDPFEEKTFLLSLHLPPSATSAVAGGSVAFAVCVGVGEGDAACSGGGNIPPEAPEEEGEETPGGSAPSSAGGGGGPPSASAPLVIFNLAGRVLGDTKDSGTLEIVWETNRPASSYVVFGPVSGGPYSLNLTLPNFGYPSATAEDLTPRTRHRVLLTNLPPGAYEARAVSREQGAPPTVSRPVVGVVLAEGETGGEGVSQQTLTIPSGMAGSGGVTAGAAVQQGGIGSEQGSGGAVGAGNPPAPFEGDSQSGEGARGLAAALGILQFNECVVSWIVVVLTALLLMGWSASVAGVRSMGFLLTPPVKTGVSVVLALSSIAALVVRMPSAALILLWLTIMSGLQWHLPVSVELRRWFSSALLISGALWFAWAIAMFWAADGWLTRWWCHPTEPFVLAGTSFLAFGFARFLLVSRS